MIRFTIRLPMPISEGRKLVYSVRRSMMLWIAAVLSVISVSFYTYYLQNGLALNYNDARSHLDIGRRVVEGLKPGLAQIGSVWLPLNHVLMIPTIWNDWMWHSGFSGALWSMICFVATGILIFRILQEFDVGLFGKLTGVVVFVLNLNILYLQATAMTELLLMATMTAGIHELIQWHKHNDVLYLIRAAFWVMLATLTRYDGWFLLAYAAMLVVLHAVKTKGIRKTDGVVVLFLTLAAAGIVLWLAWNKLIFNDILYFAFGPFSAHAQQRQLLEAGELQTKGNFLLSVKVYTYALLYSTYTVPAIIALAGFIRLSFDRTIKKSVRIAQTALLTPFIFNVLALFFGFSVVFVQGISGNSWFNVRYGILMMPTVAVYVGYLTDRVRTMRIVLVGSIALVLIFALVNGDSVALDDARYGSSQKNVSQVAGYLSDSVSDKPGLILISAASHDAIIFSSGLPMKRFIHEGTGSYWKNATTAPDRWARWIVMRTHDDHDLVWKAITSTGSLSRYRLAVSYPFADVYELEPGYLRNLNTDSSDTKEAALRVPD